jgi:hypothetical protein
MYDVPDGELQHITSDTIAYEKVELFLCSRDILIGDTLKAGKGMNIDLYVGAVNGMTTYHVIEQQGPSKGYHSPVAYNPECYPEAVKVIASISLEAKWIKEGDEFDENQIKRDVLVKEYDSESEECEYTYYHPEGDQEFKLGKFEDFIKEYPIKIKCPCCNTFK